MLLGTARTDLVFSRSDRVCGSIPLWAIASAVGHRSVDIILATDPTKSYEVEVDGVGTADVAVVGQQHVVVVIRVRIDSFQRSTPSMVKWPAESLVTE